MFYSVVVKKKTPVKKVLVVLCIVITKFAPLLRLSQPSLLCCYCGVCVLGYHSQIQNIS